MVDSKDFKNAKFVPATDFDCAVRVATQELQRTLQGDIAAQFAEDIFNSPFRLKMIFKFIPDWILESEPDAGTRDLLKRIVARYMEASEPLPDDLRLWLVRLLDDELPQPKKIGRPSKWSNHVRDIAVVRTIRLIRDQFPDLKLTRNVSFDEKPNAKGRSVFDVVGLALQQPCINKPLGFSSIAGIWQRRDIEGQ